MTCPARTQGGAIFFPLAMCSRDFYHNGICFCGCVLPGPAELSAEWSLQIMDLTGRIALITTQSDRSVQVVDPGQVKIFPDDRSESLY